MFPEILKNTLTTSLFILVILTSTTVYALSPWLTHKTNVNIPNSTFFGLATADAVTGKILELKNPKPISAFELGEYGFNPIQMLIASYKKVLVQEGIPVESSIAYVRAQGSVVYTNATYADDIELMLCNANKDLPLETLYPALKKMLKTHITYFFTSKNIDVEVFVPPARTMQTPDYINLSIRLSFANGQKQHLELNIIMPDFGQEVFLEQKSILQLKCFFNLNQRCPHPDTIAQTVIDVEMVQQSAEAYFTGVKREYTGYMRYLEANGMDIPRGQLLLFAGKYLAFLLADGQWENFKSYHDNQMRVPMANRKVQAFLATKFRIKAIHKLLEASRLINNERGIELCEQMLKTGVFDKKTLEKLAEEVFTQEGTELARLCAQKKFILYVGSQTTSEAA